MANIAQLLPNRISGHLIFEWKSNSYCATIIGVSFRCACRSISQNKTIDSGINKALRVARRLKMERNLTHSTLKVSVVGHRLSVYRCDCGSVRANQHLLFFVNLSFKLSSVLDDFNADKRDLIYSGKLIVKVRLECRLYRVMQETNMASSFIE